MTSYDEHLISMAGGDGEPDALDLDAIQARADAATEGPWGWDHGNPRRVLDGKNGEQIMSCAVLLYPERRNAEFIAHARTDVPALLALVREQQARIGRVEALADDYALIDADDLRAALTATEGA